MICEKCKVKEASVHLTRIVNGEKTEQHLCTDCAQKENAPFSAFSNGTTFPGLFQSFFAEPIAAHNERNELKCPNCGLSASELKKLGKLGCAQCYSAFRTQLNASLPNMHGSNRHKGKLSKNADHTLLVRKELNELRKQLASAITEEAFEEAARLRDCIHELEGKEGEK